MAVKVIKTQDGAFRKLNFNCIKIQFSRNRRHAHTNDTNHVLKPMTNDFYRTNRETKVD